MTVPSRARRLISGWSANFFQMILGVTQQVALVPVFLHFWSGEALAAWLVIYAAGNLVSIADFGLQFRAINRFLGFKSCADDNGRTAQFYAAMLRIYQGLAGFLVIPLLIGTQLLSPSAVLGFQAIANFDAAFVVMTAGMLLALPSNLVSGLYRARGLYGRVVRTQNLASLAGQVGQLIAIVATQSLLAVTLAYVVCQVAVAVYFLVLDAPRLFPFLRSRGVVRLSARWVLGQFRIGIPFAVASATELALLNLPVLLVSALVSDRVAVTQWGLTRVVAGLLRVLCVQATLPLAAELGHDYAVGLKVAVAEPLFTRVGVRDLAGEHRGLRPAAILAGFFRALDPRRRSLRCNARDHIADRHHRCRAVDPGAGLCQLQQSWRSSGTDQGTSAGRFSHAFSPAHPAHRTTGRGDCGGGERSPRFSSGC